MKHGQLKTKPYCPNCSTVLDGWTHLKEEQPEEGDITVCLYCSSVLEFDKKMMLKLASANTLEKCDFIELQDVHKAIKVSRD